MAGRRGVIIKQPKTIEKKLGREQAVGMAHFDTNTIVIDPRQPPKDYLDTLIHEYIHLLLPDWPENAVIVASSGLSDFLWKQGYRKINQ